ncbi:MAG: hypothetical protein ACKO0Z_03310, partial [Betaproteobacteria bacterium]
QAGNLLGGLVRGAGSIGATLVSPYDIAKDYLDGKGLSLDSNRQRRKDMDAALQSLGADPESLLYQGGKLTGEIAGTAGAPGLVAKGAQAIGAAPRIVNAISSGGFNLGSAPAVGAKEAILNAALRTGGGAVAGGAAAGLVNPEDATTGAVIGGAMPGSVKAAGEIGKAIKSVAANTLGATTGTSAETVRAAYNAGKSGSDEFVKNMRGQGEFDDVVAKAKEGLNKMREARGNQYRSGMVDISKDKTVLDFSPIDNAMNRVISIGNYKGVQTNKHAASVVDELSGKISEWKSLNPGEYHTPEGMDALKRAIGDIRDSTQFGTPARRAADTVYNAVKGEISAQAPTYSKVMGDYQKASATLDEITRALSLGDKASKDTAIRKLQSLMRNNAQSNYGNRLSLANELEQQGGVNLTPSIAGQAMNTWIPRGMTGALEKVGLGGAALFQPSVLAAAPIASPRVIGELAHALGRASGGVERAGSAVASLPSQNARQILENALRVSPVIGGLESQRVRQGTQ